MIHSVAVAKILLLNQSEIHASPLHVVPIQYAESAVAMQFVLASLAILVPLLDVVQNVLLAESALNTKPVLTENVGTRAPVPVAWMPGAKWLIITLFALVHQDLPEIHS